MEIYVLRQTDRNTAGKSTDIYNSMVLNRSESLRSDETTVGEPSLKCQQDVIAYPGNNGYSVDVEHTIPLTTKTPIACRP